MQSAIYEGWVRHTRRQPARRSFQFPSRLDRLEGRADTRRQPARRSFQYRLFRAYVDLDELEQVFAGLWRKGVKPLAHPQT